MVHEQYVCVVGWVVEWVMVVYLDGVLCGEDGWDAAITLARVRRTGVEQAQHTRGTRAVHAVQCMQCCNHAVHLYSLVPLYVTIFWLCWKWRPGQHHYFK